MANVLKVHHSDLTITSGSRSKDKTITIKQQAGITLQQCIDRLRQEADAHLS